MTPIVRRFHELGFRIYATEGTAPHLRARGVPAEPVLKVHQGRPNALDLMVSDRVQLLINTPLGKLTQQDDYTHPAGGAAAPGALHHHALRRVRRQRRDHRVAQPRRECAQPAGMARTRPAGASGKDSRGRHPPSSGSPHQAAPLQSTPSTRLRCLTTSSMNRAISMRAPRSAPAPGSGISRHVMAGRRHRRTL